MIVDITIGAEAPSSHEDRFILIAATSAEAARGKGEMEAERYAQRYLNGEGEMVQWAVRGISDVYAVQEGDLKDGTELYSAFVDSELADRLMSEGDSPLKAWDRQNPGRDSGQATVAEVLDGTLALDGAVPRLMSRPLKPE